MHICCRCSLLMESRGEADQGPRKHCVCQHGTRVSLMMEFTLKKTFELGTRQTKSILEARRHRRHGAATGKLATVLDVSERSEPRHSTAARAHRMTLPLSAERARRRLATRAPDPRLTA
jgi:hypothetical protein